MGQLRKRGDIWWIRYYRDGRRYEESARTDEWEKARDLLRTREGAIAGGAAITAKVGQVKFEDAAKDLITDYTVNGKRTVVDLTRRLDERLTPWFRGRRLGTITTADVRAYIAHRQKEGAANASINLELANLKRLFTLAIQSGRLLHRPYIPMLREDNVRKGFFEREQFDAVRRHLKPPLDHAVTLAYYTGWRTASEILTLQWHQIDRAAGVIRLEPGTTKNREGRTFQYRELRGGEGGYRGAMGAPRGAGSEAHPCPSCVLPRRRAGDSELLHAVGSGLHGRWLPGPDSARHAPHGGPKPQPGRCPRNRRDEDYRTQDAERVRSLRHHQRRGFG